MANLKAHTVAFHRFQFSDRHILKTCGGSGVFLRFHPWLRIGGGSRYFGGNGSGNGSFDGNFGDRAGVIP
jgi:hypothetical protein